MTKKIKKGYKASNNGVCLDMTYEVGHTYRKHSKPILCEFGFHYCKKIDDVFEYYPYQKGVTKIFEIEDLGETLTEDDKSVTNKIRIVREIPFEEYENLFKYYTFDENRNQIRRDYPDGAWETLEYDANGSKIRYEDSNGELETYEYDTKGNKIRYENSEGGWVTWKYDSTGHKIRMDNSGGHWIIWEYDVDGNMALEEDSSGYWTTWVYDSKGNVLSYKCGRKTL